MTTKINLKYWLFGQNDATNIQDYISKDVILDSNYSLLTCFALIFEKMSYFRTHHDIIAIDTISINQS